MGGHLCWRAAALLVGAAVSLAVVGSCSSFGSDDAPGAPDAVAQDVEGPGDATDDGGTDGATSELPCSDTDTVLVGPADIGAGGRADDRIAAPTRDAHYFVAKADVVARCASLYVVEGPAGTIHFGVYSDASGSPDRLLAEASFSPPFGGWMRAPLKKPVTVESGTPLWFAVGPSAGSMKLSSRFDSMCNPYAYYGTIAPGGPPLADRWSGTDRNPTCDMRAYLGP